MLYLPPEQEIFQPHPREARLVEILNVSSALGGVVFLLALFLGRLLDFESAFEGFLIYPLAVATLLIPPYRRAWGFCSKDYSHELKLNLARAAAWSYFVMFNSFTVIFVSRKTGESLFTSIPAVIYFQLAFALFVLCAWNYSTIRHPSVKWGPFCRRVAIGALAGLLPLSAAPNLERARISANESDAVQSMKEITRAEQQYASANPSVGFAPSLSLLGPAPGPGWINSELAQGRKDAYEFRLCANNFSDATHRPSFVVLARPRGFRRGAIRSFYTDDSGVIRFTAENRPATAGDPPIQSATTP